MTAIDHGSNSTHQFVVFHIGEEEYALPIAKIQEVIRYTKPRSVASDNPWIIGVISLRGKIVPIADLAGRLDISSAPGEDSKIVIVDTDSQTSGMVVDSVDEVLSIEDDRIDTGTITKNNIVCGIAKVEQRLVVILDADALGTTRALAA